MRVVVYPLLIFPLVSFPLARALAVRVEPRAATWLLKAAAVVPATASYGALALSQAGPGPQRVAALLAAPPPRRVLLMVAGAALIVLVAACALETANDLQDLLSLAHATARHR